MPTSARQLALALALAALVAVPVTPALAQASAGALYGAVANGAGAPLPGAVVTLSGEQGPPLRRVANLRGEFRFADLDPGLYQGRIELAGFSTTEYSDIPIRVGGSTTIDVVLTPAEGDAVTLIAECPLLDERRVSCGTTVTTEELLTIPTPHDPWALLLQTPGVLLDRLDVGGSAAAHPAVARAPAAPAHQNVFALEGIAIQDPAALGVSPLFYDFASFAEVQATTGGTDAATPTAGVVLDMVTRRGTNRWRAASRALRAEDEWSPGPDELDLAADQPVFEVSPRLERFAEHAADAGGPLARDRAWMWAGWNRTRAEIELATEPLLFAQPAGDREVENAAAKLDSAPGVSHRLQAFGHRSEAELDEAARGPARAVEASWRLEAPTTMGKLESSHVLGRRFALRTQVSRVESDLELSPGGGGVPLREAGGAFRQGFASVDRDSRRDHGELAGSAFFGRAVGHEIAAGAALRRARGTVGERWSATGGVLVEPPEGGPPELLLVRPSRVETELDTFSLYLQDALAIGNLIADVGLRWDRERGRRGAVRLDAHPLRPDLAPALALTETTDLIAWDSLSPRVGVTWALGGERTTFLRASWSRFADQAGTALLERALPAAGDSVSAFTPLRALGLYGAAPLEVGDPAWALAGALPATVLDPALDAPITDEALWSVEHAGAGCFSVGLRLAWRMRRDLLEARPIVRDREGLLRVATASDYVPDRLVEGMLPGGAPYAVPAFALRPGLEPVPLRWITAGDREIEHLGATLWFERRLRARWQVRSFLELREEEWRVPPRIDADPTDLAGFGDDDDAPFAPSSPFPERSGVHLHSEWRYSVAGLYHARAGFIAAVHAYGRQGYPLSFFELVQGSDGIERAVAVTDQVHPPRLPSVHQIDLRLEKEIRLGGGASLAVSADAFNLLNETPALARGEELDTTTAGWLREVAHPRVVRLGLRLELR